MQSHKSRDNAASGNALLLLLLFLLLLLLLSKYCYSTTSSRHSTGSSLKPCLCDVMGRLSTQCSKYRNTGHISHFLLNCWHPVALNLSAINLTPITSEPPDGMHSQLL
jgi:hypothetical protein